MATEQIQYDPCNDYYERLGVPSHASLPEIQRAYRAAVKTFHPDTGGDPSGREIMAVYHAYDVLGDPFKRAHYNCSRNRHGRPPTYDGAHLTRPRDRSPGRWMSAAAGIALALVAGISLLAATIAGLREGFSTRAGTRDSEAPAQLHKTEPGRPTVISFGYATPFEPGGSGGKDHAPGAAGPD